jgi:transposase
MSDSMGPRRDEVRYVPEPKCELNLGNILVFQTIDQSKKCLHAFEQDSTLVAVVELSQKSWFVAGIVPGVDRHPLKKFDSDENRLFALLQRWKQGAIKVGREIKRIVVALEAGRDGFWLARWLQASGIEAYVIHSTSVSVPREHRRAKTDRLDTELLKRATLGSLRGEPDHCRMVAIPTLEEEDAKRSNRAHQYLVGERTRLINRLKAALARLGVRNFNPKLRKASERLRALVTPEGMPLPPNTLGEMERDMQRLQFVRQQLDDVEGGGRRPAYQSRPSRARLSKGGSSPCSTILATARIVCAWLRCRWRL